jgi:hypothetical protein
MIVFSSLDTTLRYCGKRQGQIRHYYVHSFKICQVENISISKYNGITSDDFGDAIK